MNNTMSLMWRNPLEKEAISMSEEDLMDLNVENLDNLMKKDKIEIREWLLEVPINVSDSLYRQDVMMDFINNSGLLEAMKKIGNDADHLLNLSRFAFEKEATIYNLMKRMDDVEVIRNMVEGLLRILRNAQIKSEGLSMYKSRLEEVVNSAIYDAFMQDIEKFRSMEEGVKSIKIGLNLDEYLQPIEAILLDLSEEAFKYNRFEKKMDYYIGKGIQELKLIPRKIFAKETILPPDPLNNLEKVVEPAMLQLISFCDQFNTKILETLSLLHREMNFYQIGLTIYHKMEGKGYRMTFPKWEEGPYHLVDVYPLDIALVKMREDVVKNTLEWEKKQRIFILTGANRGGKTTLTQAMMQCFWMGQIGFFIPATKAKLPYVKQLLIHFPKEEKETVTYGRLGEECFRFKKLYDRASQDAFYFLNESFAGTSYQESIEIAQGAIRAIYKKGGYVMYNTHLHEILNSIEDYIPQEAILSYVVDQDVSQSPYRIRKGRPLGKSYGIEMAKNYGMSYDQLMAL